MSTTPAFADLHDLDKGAVLIHLWKVGREGGAYARENYPCRFLADEDLCALERDEANNLARFYGSHAHLVDTLGQEEADRLYDLALDIDKVLRGCPEDVSTPRRRAHTARVLAWLAAPDAMTGTPRRPFLLHAAKARFVDGEGESFGRFEVR